LIPHEPPQRINRTRKKRHSALTRTLKPYTTFATLVSAGLFIYKFLKNSGEFTFTLLGLAALTLFLVYYATSLPAAKLLVRRPLALFIDLFLIGVALFVSMSWYQANIERPGDILQIQLGKVLMLALWLALLYFVFFDWRFKGTIGKRFLGLTVMAVERNKVSFGWSFIRTFLSLPLPVISAAFLNHWITDGNQSALRLFIGDALKNLLVSFVPMSILFFGGNQSIADRLTHIAIRAEHGAANVLAKIEFKTWILLCFSNLVWALLFASLWHLAVSKPFLNGPSKPPPAGALATWIVTDPQSAASLWTFLALGLKEPTFGIRKIELLEASPNPFMFQAEESHFLTRLNPERYLKTIKKMPFVGVTLTRERPLQVKLLVLQNFATFVAQKTPMNERPAFSLIQIATEKEFGLFSINQQENLLFCMMSSGNNPVDFYTDVRPHGAIQFPVSLDEIGFLLVGAGIPY
jgi:uncharacterized RDD family membrane protein YckC